MKLSKNQMIGVSVAIVVIVIFFFQFFGDSFLKEPSISEFNQLDLNSMTEKQPESKSLVINNIEAGTGLEAVAGSLVSVHYTGRLDDGTIFDSSVERGTPFEFMLGAGQVIRGWDEGVVGMKVGGKRTLVISPEFAYGVNGITHPQTGEKIIPGNATLTFEVELLGVTTQ